MDLEGIMLSDEGQKPCNFTRSWAQTTDGGSPEGTGVGSEAKIGGGGQLHVAADGNWAFGCENIAVYTDTES